MRKPSFYQKSLLKNKERKQDNAVPFYPRDNKGRGKQTKRIEMQTVWERTQGRLQREGRKKRRPEKICLRKGRKGRMSGKESLWKRRETPQIYLEN